MLVQYAHEVIPLRHVDFIKQITLRHIKILAFLIVYYFLNPQSSVYEILYRYCLKSKTHLKYYCSLSFKNKINYYMIGYLILLYQKLNIIEYNII